MLMPSRASIQTSVTLVSLRTSKSINIADDNALAWLLFVSVATAQCLVVAWNVELNNAIDQSSHYKPSMIMLPEHLRTK